MTLEVGPFGHHYTLCSCDGCGHCVTVDAGSEERAVALAEAEAWRFPDESDRAFCPRCSDRLDIEARQS